MANTSRYARDPVWCVPENSVFSLGILVSPLTTEKLKMAHVDNNTHTQAIRLGFLIENFFVKLTFQVFCWDFYTDPYTFAGFPFH